MVAEAFIPNPENKPQVNHIDADIYNNNVWNLEWNTPMENTHHAKRLGLLVGPRGAKNWRTVFTEADVLEIRRLGTFLTKKQIMEKYNASSGAIFNILVRRTWKYI